MIRNRRNFIKTIILGSGAVFVNWQDVFAHSSPKVLRVQTGYTHSNVEHEYVHNHKPLPQPSQRGSVEYVIIGGGAAGLAAAWQLKKAGKDFVILENESHLGGVMHTSAPQWKGISYPLGSTYFARYDDVFKEFLTDLNVRPMETGEDAFFFPQDNIIVDPWNPTNISQLPISKDDREAFRTFRDFVLALPLPTYPLERASVDILKEYDSLSAHAFVGRFKSPVLNNFMDLYSRSVLGAPLSEVNAFSFLSFYSVEFGDAFNLPCYTFQGGLGAIASAAEQFLGSHVRTNAVAVKIENRNGGAGVEVSYIDAATGERILVQAKRTIVATPKKTARKIVAGLPDEQSKAMDELRYAPYITVTLCCNAPLFPVRAFDFWLGDKQGRFTDIIDVTSSEDAASKNLQRKGSFVYMLSAPRPAKTFSTMDESALEKHLAVFAQEMAQAVNDNIPGVLEKIEELHVFGWRHSMVIPLVGSYQRFAPIISRTHGNVHFAHSDNDIAPGWENAVWHGVEAARRVMG